ncbi:hypothetical protein BCR43DRAFT_200532 [Syncephalastrum racemosum]|uniref:Uncharacterized protein n=1 Tax=Syncephalastrum racemosum TaxID=13706 RepID=A0A1X2HHV5_SYNRA|nr:hypothetical protein BCR43DRAFT_200532 [Syncephalastrum racemosum]
MAILRHSSIFHNGLDVIHDLFPIMVVILMLTSISLKRIISMTGIASPRFRRPFMHIETSLLRISQCYWDSVVRPEKRDNPTLLRTCHGHLYLFLMQDTFEICAPGKKSRLTKSTPYTKRYVQGKE